MQIENTLQSSERHSHSHRNARHRDKRRSRIVAACLIVGLAICVPAQATEDVNRIVLRVNDEIVTLFDYESRKSAEIARILSDPSLTSSDRQLQLEQIGREVMSSLFGEMLLMSYADQQGIRISDREVDEAVSEMQQQRGLKTREELEVALASSGMTFEDLHGSVRRELVWNQVIGREVQGRVELGEEEVRAYYRNHPEDFRVPEERWLREIIVLESSGLGETELSELAERLSGELRGGSDAEELAASHSEQGLTSGLIDLGWLKEDEIGETLAEAAWQLEEGGTSAPVLARGGYHILQAVEVKPAEQRPFDEVQGQIERWMRNQRFNKELRKFMVEVEQQAYIQENLPADAVGYQTMADNVDLEDELEVFRGPVAAAVPETPAGDDALQQGSGESRRR